jgi:hypothetical protein
LTAFILIILFTILLSTGVEYLTSRKGLDEYATKIRSEDLASGLGRTYSRDKNWDRLEPTLIRYGFLIDPDDIQRKEEAGVDLVEVVPFGVVVKDAEGKVIADTYSKLEPGENVKL